MKSAYRITPLLHLVMWLRRMPIREVKAHLRRCEKAHVEVDPEMFETHWLAGGDLEDFVDGLIFAKENNLTCCARAVAARQLVEKALGGQRSVVTNLREFRDAGVTDLTKAPIRYQSPGDAPRTPCSNGKRIGTTN